MSSLPDRTRARLAGPLLKHAAKRAKDDIFGPFSGREIAADLACVLLSWGSDWTFNGNRWFEVTDPDADVHMSMPPKW